MKHFKEETEYTETVWTNTTVHTATFRLMLDKPGRAPHSSKFRVYTIKPGDKVSIPSYYSDAIRTEDKYGKVIGGLCPWLKKAGEGEVEMEKCLDFETIASNIELEVLAKKIQKDKALEEAIKVQAENKVKGERPKKSI